jgi:hypothetical protein
LNLVYKHYLC